MIRSRSVKVQVHSLHAKIERRLIYQAIFCSLFQLVYFILNYLSSLDSNAKVLFIYVNSSTLGYHLQHYAVMITHFIFSPTFKVAFLSFYHLKFLTKDRNTTKIVMLSKGLATQRSSVPRATRTISTH
uniref:Uncharacterized protein n=1 Tax=Panagrolaimus sp. PS1159 TaxID=55785 RepID=A0AC35F1N4_9BILA